MTLVTKAPPLPMLRVVEELLSKVTAPVTVAAAPALIRRAPPDFTVTVGMLTVKPASSCSVPAMMKLPLPEPEKLDVDVTVT